MKATRAMQHVQSHCMHGWIRWHISSVETLLHAVTTVEVWQGTEAALRHTACSPWTGGVG